MTNFHELPTAVLENEHLRLEYLTTGGPRIVGLSFQGSPNLFADVADIAWDTPLGKYHPLGGHRLWISPESPEKTYIPDKAGLQVRQIQNGVELNGAGEPGSGVRKSIRIELETGRPVVRLVHSIVNENAVPITFAPWVITMFALGGRVVMPQPQGNADPHGLLHNRLLALWPYTRIQDLRLTLRDDFLLIQANAALPPLKLGYACTAGWLATIGVHRWGGYAEYVAVPASNVALIPEALSFDHATVIARHGAAAYNFLIDRGKLRAGETVLVFGASGALGGFAVQVAKLSGATVLAVAGADKRAAFADQLGADAAINYRTGDLVEQVMALTNGRGADLVFESSGDPELWPLALRCVAQAGRLVSCGAHGGGNVQLDLKRLYVGRIQIIGAAGVNVSDLDWALAAGARGDICATIDRVYPLECAAEAQDYVERERPLGKVLIALGRIF